MVTNSALQLSVLQLLQKMRLSLAFVETRQKSWSSYPIFFFFQIQSSTVRISYRKFSKEFTLLLFPIYPPIVEDKWRRNYIFKNENVNKKKKKKKNAATLIS